MAKFLFMRDEVLRRTGTDADPKYLADHVYELTGDHVERWHRRSAGHSVPDDTPLGKYISPEERAAAKAAKKAQEKPAASVPAPVPLFGQSSANTSNATGTSASGAPAKPQS